MSFIELQGVTRTYGAGEGRVTPLADVDLGIERGEFFVLLGPSGSGKTTLLNLIAGIDRPDGGKVLVGDKDLAELRRGAMADWRAEHVGYVFQNPNLVPVLTAYENVEVPLWLFRMSAAERHRRVETALAAVAFDGSEASRAELVGEVADLMYHVQALLLATGLDPLDVALELERRHLGNDAARSPGGGS